jgi:type I restriction enzyme, S subunit
MVDYPSINTQKKIAAILSAYDELIENNKRRIMLLEKMAEEIYREWFVRLRFPGHEKVRFIKGVPAGWRTLRFSELCEFQKGKAPDKVCSERQVGLLSYINVEFLEGQSTGYVMQKRNSIVAEDGDVLMLMDGARSGLVFRAKRGIVGSTFARVAVKKIYRDVVFEFLRVSREHIMANNTGSAIPHANKEFIHRLILFLPPSDDLIVEFNSYYRSLFEQTMNLQKQNENLLHSRDLLFPRLMSGKLSVKNLDIQFPPTMQDEMENVEKEVACA